jgi:hypothetical protein
VPHHAHVAAFCILQRNGDAEVLHLWIGKHFIDPVDRPGGTPSASSCASHSADVRVEKIGAISALICGRLRVRSAPLA